MPASMPLNNSPIISANISKFHQQEGQRGVNYVKRKLLQPSFLCSQAEERLKDCKKNITVAIMGCAVNGPGEAREADIGIAGGIGHFQSVKAVICIVRNESFKGDQIISVILHPGQPVCYKIIA